MAGYAKRRVSIALAVLTIGTVSILIIPEDWRAMIKARITGQATITDRVDQFGANVDARLRPIFDAAGVPYPPKEIYLVAYKAERRLDMFAVNESNARTFVTSYPILGASGKLGPKLREGDGQVPEGIYTIDGLNPNSQFHLSLHVNYPNAFDRDMAQRDGRTQLGHSIFIHGGRSSIGCLAMGDDVAEELFILIARLPKREAVIVISPGEDLLATHEALEDPPRWIDELYERIENELARLPKGSAPIEL